MSENGKSQREGARRDRLVFLGLGFLIAVVVLGIFALLYGGSVQAEETSSGMSFRVAGFQHLTLEEALDEAWKKDSGSTRSLILSWGKGHGIIDGQDLGQVEDALQKYHARQWHEIANFAKHLQSMEKENEIGVKIGYAATGAIGPGTLYFKGGDKRFADYSNPDCEVEIGRATLKEKIGGGGIVTGSADVQIPLNDLISLYARRFGQGSVPPASSKAYDAIRNEVEKLGVIPGKVYIQ